MRRIIVSSLECSVVALAAAFATPAFAQETSPPVPTGNSGDAAKPTSSVDAKGASSVEPEDGSPLTQTAPAAAVALDTEDIVVTAQRREQRLQNAPVAVTALSAASLDQLNIRSSQDLMQVVPGLQSATQTAGDGGGSATFFLRGLGQERSGNGSEPAVGVYVDDFYYPTLSGSLFKIVDLAQVEVLRGPQGTLFGRNTVGGAIRYTSQRPELNELSGHVTGTVGSRNRYELTGAFNLPIGDFAALRLTGGHLEQDGWVRIGTTGEKAGRTRTDLVRGQLRVEPTSNLSVDLSAQWSKDKLDGFTYTLPAPFTISPPAAGQQPGLPFLYNVAIAPRRGLPLFTSALASRCFYCQPGPNRPEFSYTTYKNALATVRWTFAEGFTLKSLTGWQDVSNVFSADLDGTIAQIFSNGVSPSKTQAFSQELQLNGQLLDDKLNFVAGGYYYNQRNPLRFLTEGQQVLGNIVTTGPREERQVKSYAGFIDGSFALTDKLSLLGGFRASQDKKDVRAVSPASKLTVGTREATFDSTTYRAGLQYQWTPDIMTYANLSTGFRAGGFNPFNAAPLLSFAPFEPEKAKSYEIGLRSQFLDRRITINPTIFYVDWTNIQIQSVVITDAVTGTGGPVLQNVAGARSYGGELEWAVRPTDDVRLFGNFSYLNIRYTKISASTGLTRDSELQRSPPITFSLGGSHTLDFAGTGRVVTTLNYSFQDDQQSSPLDAVRLPGYGLLNGRIEFISAGNGFSVAGFVTNVFDKRYFVGGVDYTDIVGSRHFDVGRPREIGVTARVNF